MHSVIMKIIISLSTKLIFLLIKNLIRNSGLHSNSHGKLDVPNFRRNLVHQLMVKRTENGGTTRRHEGNFLPTYTASHISRYPQFFESLFVLIGRVAQSVQRLRVGRSGDRIPVGRNFPLVHTSPEAQPASCKMGTGTFPGVKYGRNVLLTNYPLLVAVLEQQNYTSTHPLSHNWACKGNTLNFSYLISNYISTNYINILGYPCTYSKQYGYSFALYFLIFFLFSKDRGNILIFLMYMSLTTKMYRPVQSILSTLCRRLEWFRYNFAQQK